jgi:broad specificity phosphatase PhoE
MSELNIFRHGQSTFNEWDIDRTKAAHIPRDVTLDRDASLTPQGESQAVQLGEVLAETLGNTPHNLITVFVSDWTRAIDTAKIVLARVNNNRDEADRISYQSPDPRLTDQHLGLTEPKYVVDNPSILAESYDHYWRRRNDGKARGRIYEKPVEKLSIAQENLAREIGLKYGVEIYGESLEDVITRLQDWYDDRNVRRIIVAPNHRSIVFAHGGIHYASRAVFMGESNEELANFMNSPEGSVGNCAKTSYINTADMLWSLDSWAKSLEAQLDELRS